MEGKSFKSFIFIFSSFLVRISLLHISHLSLTVVHRLLLPRIRISLVAWHWLLWLIHLGSHLWIHWRVIWLVHLSLLSCLMPIILVRTWLLLIVASLIPPALLIIIELSRSMVERFVMETSLMVTVVMASESATEVIEIVSSVLEVRIILKPSVPKSGIRKLWVLRPQH